MTRIQQYVEAVFSGKGAQALRLYLSYPRLTDEFDMAVWKRLQRKEEQGFEKEETYAQTK